MISHPTSHDADRPAAAAIGLLARQGYDATSVDDLADAAGMSRSTFFRKFGSKEDVVFADHERILRQVTERLAETMQEPLAAIGEAALLVFNHHLRNPETSRARYELMQAVPALRDRELVTSHRYERAFLLHLLASLPDVEHRQYMAVSFAAAAVAVHNAFLRRWLRSAPAPQESGTADRDTSGALANELRALSEIFRPALFGPGTPAQAAPAVVVTVLAAGADKDAIVQAVRDALP
ncbi:TetR/AcrR family transcriptional regulator [Arthrobacter sp. PsM3]|uniref:TetR/AcrR family transcriptional regulator n=1 Tax=Arthrobacter sp. PsM3 TaxID=3030531 RepID=UPI00263A6F42|nr:TetR/AcrR family transcriptional regulator [Arthrobacter sp. PsM3]MDN4643105.1 helix-turn-helix domain containing protein [Arthrobacter sp. PsM3]